MVHRVFLPPYRIRSLLQRHNQRILCSQHSKLISSHCLWHVKEIWCCPGLRDAFYNHKLWSLSIILLTAIGPHIVHRFKIYPVQGFPVSRAHQSLSYIANCLRTPTYESNPHSYSQTGCWNPTDSPILKSYLLGCYAYGCFCPSFSSSSK